MYKCNTCNKTIKKKNVCPDCSKLVQNVEIPLTERLGRCSNCGHGAFVSAIKKRHWLRCCKQCKEVVDTDDNMKVIRRGNHEIF